MDEFYIFLISVAVIHCILFFFDILFKTCSHVPYLYFLKNTGIEVKPFRIIWFTTLFNRQIQKWGTIRPRLQLAWFTAGSWVSVLMIPFAVILVLHSMIVAVKHIFLEENISSTVMVVEPLVPGWNMPSSDFSYYLVTLLISSVIHELGHAVAAVRDDVHVAGFSITLFFIIPVAATHLEQLDHVSNLKKLRVLCAGVWHNIFLAIIAAIIATTLPWILFPFFDFGTGVQVKYVKEGSMISRPGGLREGDKITEINQCLVQGSTSWQTCLAKSVHEANTGFCIPDNFIKEHDESVPAKHLSDGAVECCNENSSRHLCFEYVESEDEPLPLPQHSCLNARSVIGLSSFLCLKAPDCPTPYHCFRPSLENSTKLLRINRANGDVVLFLGHPVDIYRNVRITDFINVYRFIPSHIPDVLTKLCHFLTIFSSGIAILNIIPCFCLDGQIIVSTLVDILLVEKVPVGSVRHAIALCITIFGTLIMILYIFLMLYVTLDY